MVEQWNRDGGTMEHVMWNNRGEIVEQWNSGTEVLDLMVEQ